MDFTKKRVIAENETFRFRVFRDRVVKAPSGTMQHHSEYEFVYVFEGSGIYQIENILYSVRQGDMITLLPNERHLYYGLDHKPYSAYVILFDESVLTRFSNPQDMRILLNSLSNPTMHHLPHKHSLDAKQQQCILSLFDNMFQLSNATELSLDYRMNTLSGLVCALLYHVSLLRGSSVDNISSDAQRSDPLINQALQYINQHYDEAISLDTLAKRLYVNPSYLSRTFKKNTGYALITYVNVKRITQACYYLSETSLPITQIALLVGFNSISYFCVMFKRMVGCVPNEYRQNPEKYSIDGEPDILNAVEKET